MGKLRRVHDGYEHILGAEHRVGRGSSCALHLERNQVSTNHAVIRWLGDQWSVADLGSRNGTYLNGERLEPGQRLPLELDAYLEFGDAAERWLVVDVAAPCIMAVPLDGGAPHVLADGLIVLPDDDDPIATLFLREARWVLEMDSVTRPLVDGEVFHVGARAYRFESAHVASRTDTLARHPVVSMEPRLRFRVSPDEEHVELALEREDGWLSLGTRSCYYLGLTLARARLSHQREGLSEHGWVDVEQLLKMLPEYGSAQHLNVDVHRLRTLLARAGVADASQVIERRHGQMRIGTAHVLVEAHRDR